jgi:hypothetical protein
MKVHDKMKNNLNRESQRCVESRSIELMKKKMPWAQFVSIGNSFRLRLCIIAPNGEKGPMAEFESMPEPKRGEVLSVELLKALVFGQSLRLNLRAQRFDAHKIRVLQSSRLSVAFELVYIWDLPVEFEFFHIW